MTMTKQPASPQDKLYALLMSKRLKGLKEADIRHSLRAGDVTVLELAQELEAEGRAVILSFDPLFLLSRESLEFFQDKIVKLVEQHHAMHPDELGLPLDKLLKKFEVPKKTTLLALKLLERSGKTRQTGDLVALQGFRYTLTPAEETLLGELEQMSLRNELDAAALRDVQSREHVSPKKMEKLLSVLMERKRIVQGRNGFYVHSEWLDGLIAKVRARESRELTVGDFKEITSLSRKYAIPLLELLDQMGVTRRKGSIREIL